MFREHLRNITKTMNPYCRVKIRFNLFLSIYSTFSKHALKASSTKDEKDLIYFFETQFQQIILKLTTQNVEEILDELCELRDDCHEKYEEIAKMSELTMEPFRIICDGDAIGGESSRRPCVKKFKYEGFYPVDG